MFFFKEKFDCVEMNHIKFYIKTFVMHSLSTLVKVAYNFLNLLSIVAAIR